MIEFIFLYSISISVEVFMGNGAMAVSRTKNLALYFYIMKVCAGTVLGVVFGFVNPSWLLAFVVSVIVLAWIIVFFRYFLGFSDVLVKLVLWYGTFSYFITIIAFWSLIYNVVIS